MSNPFTRALRALAALTRRGATRPPAVPVENPGRPGLLTGEDRNWLLAHTTAAAAEPGKSLIHADLSVQQWMATVLTDLGWSIEAPLMVSEGWAPARGQDASAQSFVTFTTPSKCSAFARSSDPATAKSAGAAAAARQSITATSHHGLILAEFARAGAARPGRGLTAAEAVVGAGLARDDATGSAWHRVTDLRDRGLITPLLDGTGARTRRRNTSGSEAEVLVLTPLGTRAHAALDALAARGFVDEPLTFDGYVPDTLFGDDAARLAHVPATETQPA